MVMVFNSLCFTGDGFSYNNVMVHGEKRSKEGKSSVRSTLHVVKSISVPFRGPPRYNPRRRSAIGWPIVGGLGGLGGHYMSGGGGGSVNGHHHNHHHHHHNNGGMGTMMTGSATMIDLRTLTRLGMVGPPSPCPSEQPFSSASSSLSEGSSHRSHEDDISIVTGNVLLGVIVCYGECVCLLGDLRIGKGEQLPRGRGPIARSAKRMQIELRTTATTAMRRTADGDRDQTVLLLMD